MTKRKLLLVSAISPFPQDSGGATRIKNTIKELSKYFEIYLISFKNESVSLAKEEESLLNTWCKKTYFVNTKPNDNFAYINVGQPYWFSPWYSIDLINLTNKIIKGNKIEILQVEFSQLLYLIDYISDKDKMKTIFTAHDISTISFWRRLKEITGIKIKIAHYIRFLEIYFYEKKYLPKYDQINSVSENDKVSIKEMFKVNNVINVPNGIEKVEFLKPNQKNKKVNLGYIGSFSHTPNITGFTYFLNEIAPLLEKSKIPYRYYLAGKNDIKEINRYMKNIPSTIKNRIIILGFVEKPVDFYKKIDILITPIFAGSGSRIKILEALGFGKKIISSPVGAEGINIKTSLISIANTPYEYINKIKDYAKNKNIVDEDEEKKNISKLTWEYIFNENCNSPNNEN